MRRLLVLAATLVVVAGCRADVVVEVDVAQDGSGTVTVTADLDAEVVAQVSDLPDRLRVDDAAAAGWVVTEPVPLDGGGLRLAATKAVDRPEDFAAVLAEIHPSLFPDTELEVRRSFATNRHRWRSTVDRSVGVEVFGDDELASALGGEPFGVPLATLAERAGAPLDDVVTVDLVVRLPGGAEAALGPAALGGTAAELRLADAVSDQAAIDERSRSERLRSALPLVLAIAGIWWLLVLGAVWVWMNRRAAW